MRDHSTTSRSIEAARQMERATMEATSSSSRHVSEARTMDLTARRHCRTFHSQRIRAIMPSPSRAPARPFAPPHRGLPIPTARRTAEKLKADGVHERCQPFSMSFGQHSKGSEQDADDEDCGEDLEGRRHSGWCIGSHDASLHDADTTGIKHKKMKDLNVGRSYRPTVLFPFRLAVINGT